MAARAAARLPEEIVRRTSFAARAACAIPEKVEPVPRQTGIVPQKRG
jgi:hypothetical protein